MPQTVYTNFVLLFARIFIATIFLGSAVNKILNFADVANMMGGKNLPMPSLLLAGAIAFLVAGGLSILLGVMARWGSILLMIFLVSATLVFHNFWAFKGDAFVREMIQFQKNLAIFGGLMLIHALGSGEFSLDRFLPTGR
jgi:putative oxidoreductase